jgi:hypothetical protein
MHVSSMPPDALPPDDPGASPSAEHGEGNVVDPAVLAERRAQRAEHERETAERRAADAQALAAELARERARLEAERDALRLALERAIAEGGGAARVAAREPLVPPGDAEPVRTGEPSAPPQGARPPAVRESAQANGNDSSPAITIRDLRHELTVARATAARPAAPPVPPAPPRRPAAPMPALARERALVARRAAEGPLTAIPSAQPAGTAERAAPATALALERERSSRLQALLDRSTAAERELREQVGALQRSVVERRDAEQRIAGALRRLRSEWDAAARAPEPAAPPPSAAAPAPQPGAPAEAAAAPEPAAPPAPIAAPVEPAPAAETAVPAEPGPEAAPFGPAAEPPAIDADRLEQARDRLRASVAAEEPAPTVAAPAPPGLPAGPPAPWLPAALRRLAQEDPAAAGRMLVGMLPAQGLVTQRALHYDLVLAGRGCIGVDVGSHGTTVRPQGAPRSRRDVDFRVSADEAGLARLLLGRRGLRRRARVRGSRRRLRELRHLASEPLALRDLGAAGALLDPALALQLAALAIDPAQTAGHRFTIAHTPLAGSPADAWLRVQDGDRPLVLATRPGESPATTIRSTRGAILPLLAGIAPPPGEAATIDGDPAPIALLRTWIAATEFPGA